MTFQMILNTEESLVKIIILKKRQESTVQLLGGQEERGDADLSRSARICQVARS